MTLRIHAPNPIRVGETRNVLVTSDNPGVVSLVYGAGLTGPSSVTIPGTRVWRNGLKHGQYLSCDGAATASRNEFTLFVAVMTDTLRRSTSAYTYAFPIGNLFDNGSGIGLTNWGLCAYRLPTVNPLQDTCYFAFLYTPSPPAGSSSAAGFSTFGCTSTPTLIRLAVTYNGTTLRRMINSRTAAAASNVTISGTCGSEYLVVQHTLDVLAKLESVASDDDLDAWFADGTIPATDREFVFSGGHEVVEDAPVFWDSAGTNDLKTVAIPSGSYPAAASGDYTDDPGDPVVPYALVPVTAVATTGCTIDATRPRQGVPARASEAERIETATQVTVTVENQLVSIGPDTNATVAAYPADVYLQVCATPDGVVSLASDDPNLTVPATVEVSGGSATVICTALADVTGATITATYGATTEAATVSVTEAPEPEELLAIGPDTVAEVESYPAEIVLLLTSNVDGDAEITSDNENLIPMSPVTAIDGKAEVACLVTADVSGATITASRDPGPSDSCSVTVSDVLTGDWIACGPNQRTRIEGKRIVWPIRVRSSKDGAFTATADPGAGIIIAGPFELASGACDITAQPTQAGTWTLTVEQDGRMDSVTLEALPAAAIPAPRQYNLSAEIDAFFDFINRKHGFRPRFTPANVQDVRAEHATDRTYSRYAQGTGQPGSVFGAVALSYQVMISYSSVTMAEQDLGILREEADRYGWNAIGFSMTGQTMFEPIKMMPRLTLTMNFDIIPQGR